jgi:hypothetical protein
LNPSPHPDLIEIGYKKAFYDTFGVQCHMTMMFV